MFLEGTMDFIIIIIIIIIIITGTNPLYSLSIYQTTYIPTNLSLTNTFCLS